MLGWIPNVVDSFTFRIEPSFKVGGVKLIDVADFFEKRTFFNCIFLLLSCHEAVSFNISKFVLRMVKP